MARHIDDPFIWIIKWLGGPWKSAEAETQERLAVGNPLRGAGECYGKRGMIARMQPERVNLEA